MAALVTVLLAARYRGQATGSPADIWLYSHLSGGVLGSAIGYSLAWVIGTAGDPAAAGVLMLCLAVVCLITKRRRLALLAIAGPVLTGAVTTGLKPLVGRTIHGDHLSFPSGHTAQLTALAMVLGLLLVQRLGPAGPLGTPVVLGAAALGGAAMSWSQTASSVHYATDTLAGFCVAVAVVPMAGWILDVVADRWAG